jgi:hypothetical protein
MAAIGARAEMHKPLAQIVDAMAKRTANENRCEGRIGDRVD